MISRDQLAKLADAYDRYANALDPLDPATDAAEQEFLQMLDQLRAAHGPGADPREFRRLAISQCKQFLKKNG